MDRENHAITGDCKHPLIGMPCSFQQKPNMKTHKETGLLIAPYRLPYHHEPIQWSNWIAQCNSFSRGTSIEMEGLDMILLIPPNDAELVDVATELEREYQEDHRGYLSDDIHVHLTIELNSEKWKEMSIGERFRWLKDNPEDGATDEEIADFLNGISVPPEYLMTDQG
jgi:hypothetical protein